MHRSIVVDLAITNRKPIWWNLIAKVTYQGSRTCPHYLPLPMFLLRCHSHVIVVHVCADASLNAAAITVGVEPPAGAPAMPTGPPGASTSAPFATSAWPCIGARQMFVRIARAHAPRYDHLIKSITAPKLDIFTPCLLELDKFPVGVHRDTPLRRCVLVVKTTGSCDCARSLCLWP